MPDTGGLGGPILARDDDSAGFFDAAARDALVVRRCPACPRLYAPHVLHCPGCGGALEWAPASGRGTLITWAVVHRSPHPALADQVPYVTAVVELEEGPWLHARLLLTDVRALRAGMELTAVFVHPADGESYPVFTTPGDETATRAGA
jgi:uncharacterized OB-fold protein